jgi:L-iditol 2-dehydrogenase
MKAALLTGIGQFEVKQVSEPEVRRDTDVLVRIRMVGVCGSDIHYYRTGRIGRQVVQFPSIIGHEAAGVVERIGRNVKRVKPGQRIAIDPAVSCGQCDQCLAGRENTCRRLVFMGCPGQLGGALCDYVVHPETSCYPIGDGTTFEQAVLSEPLAIAVYSVERTPLPAGASVGILGAGPIGMSVFHALRTRDIGEVYVTDKVPERLSFAQRLNPRWTGNPDQTDVAKEIAGLEPSGLDAVYECSGDPAAYVQGIRLLKPGGSLVVVGIPEVDDIPFPIHELRRREVTVLNIRRQAHCTQKAIELLAGRRVDMDAMASHHFPLEATPQAFDLVAHYRDGVMKAMITLG